MRARVCVWCTPIEERGEWGDSGEPDLYVCVYVCACACVLASACVWHYISTRYALDTHYIRTIYALYKHYTWKLRAMTERSALNLRRGICKERELVKHRVPTRVKHDTSTIYAHYTHYIRTISALYQHEKTRTAAATWAAAACASAYTKGGDVPRSAPSPSVCVCARARVCVCACVCMCHARARTRTHTHTPLSNRTSPP